MRIFFAVFRKIIIFAHWYSAFCWICSRTLRGCVDWNRIRQRNRRDRRTSHPTWVRGLKLEKFWDIRSNFRSHPTWVRGLKLFMGKNTASNCSRTLRGCVDWNKKFTKIKKPIGCRTLRGCVDWNTIVTFISFCISKSHPTWVRGLKQIVPRLDNITV